MHLSSSGSSQPSKESNDQRHEELDSLLRWFEQIESKAGEQVRDRFTAAWASQRQAVAEEFSREHDTVRLVGQDNLRRYRSVRLMTIRINAGDDLGDALIAISAAVAAGTQVSLSIDIQADPGLKELLESTADYVPGLIHPLEESDDQLIDRFSQGHVGRIRMLGESSPQVYLACAEQFVTVVNDPVLVDGRIECLRYMDEQSISHDYHRYGNLGRRADESRRDVL